MQSLLYINDFHEYSCLKNPLKSELITKQACWDESVVSLFFSLSIHTYIYVCVYVYMYVLREKKNKETTLSYRHLHIYIYIYIYMQQVIWETFILEMMQ